jgi:hypothetical protein
MKESGNALETKSPARTGLFLAAYAAQQDRALRLGDATA